MNFIRKLKPLTKTTVTVLLLLSVIITMPAIISFATAVDTGVSGNAGAGNTTQWDTSGAIHDTALRQSDIGLRIYVTDSYGNVQKTDSGYDAIDFLYNDLKEIRSNSKLNGYNGSNYLRCTANPKGNYNIAQENIFKLGFSEYETSCTKSNCICRQEYFVDRIKHDLRGPIGHPIRQKLFTSTGDGGNTYAEDNLIKQYWGNSYKDYLSKREADNDIEETNELYLQVEIVFAIVHHVSEPNTPEWYGSVFEFGCYSEAENRKRLYTKDTSKYVVYEADYWRYLPNSFYIQDNFEAFENFPYMQPATYQNRSLKPSEIENKAYGMYAIKFSQIVQPEIEVPDTEIPVSGDIEVKKEEATTISKVQNEDVEIRTGYNECSNVINGGLFANKAAAENFD